MSDPMDDETIRAILLVHTYSIQAMWAAQIKLRRDPEEYLGNLQEQLLAAAPAQGSPKFRDAFERQARNLVSDLRDACAEDKET